MPTATFNNCPKLDVICIPGGPGQIDIMQDRETLEFICQKEAKEVKYITSVCTGSLVLGAAGLLKGYRATCHWASLDQLTLLGAIPVKERVVHDKNIITGAGVTSGIDFSLEVISTLYDKELAESIQLYLEYDPQPPFCAGNIQTAPKEVVTQVTHQMSEMIAKRLEATKQAAAFLSGIENK
ncbi:MAG: DJ-1/PfpI family protein [Neisseriaceae bacterium]|nr:DJ-1/PfpI family protein [Neisseriaceae bacterium]